MTGLADSCLLAAAFDSPPGDPNADERARLRGSYLAFKERATLLAGEISRDLPHFTVHDGSHLDALWELADTVTKPGATLNPLEAYVLGGAILLHDLGLALASYPGGGSDLRALPEWGDALVAALEQQLDRPALKAELDAPPREAEKEAEKWVLRQRHAAHAEELALMSWDTRDRQLFLIEDSELRYSYGPLMGLIAHSHWWPTASLPAAFTQSLGAPTWCPADWAVDPLRLACLLRVCDALHLDARRAPLFLRALREPPPASSADHWTYQQRLARPYLNGAYMEFTAGEPFGPEDANAWWLCHDTLRSANRWISETQATLAGSNREGLAVQGVAGVEDPSRLAELIPTRGWIPVDTDVQVSNVANLVVKLGGGTLYGPENLYVALRELIQNGVDAVRARRLMEGRDETWGRVSVSLSRDLDKWCLEVADTGVGMSRDRLGGALLDFGSSFWSSGAVARELPGLLSQGFKSTGRYGIGFFSAFMLGSRVEVVSRPFAEALEETHALTFRSGVAARPLLSKAAPSELPPGGGTRVRVWLEEGMPERLVRSGRQKQLSLAALCSWLCPALEVDLFVDGDSDGPVVRANDWLDLDGGDLLARVAGTTEILDDPLVELAAASLGLLREPDGTVVGRAAFLPLDERGLIGSVRKDAMVTVGGLRSVSVRGFSGVLVGESTTAARDAAAPIVKRDALAAWATTQAKLAAEADVSAQAQAEISDLVVACGGDPGSLPVALSAQGWLRQCDLELWLARRRLVIVVEHTLTRFEEVNEGEIELYETTLRVNNPYGISIHNDDSDVTADHWPYRAWHDESAPYSGSVQSLIVEQAARAWDHTIEEILASSRISFAEKRQFSGPIGTRDGKPVHCPSIDYLISPSAKRG